MVQWHRATLLWGASVRSDGMRVVVVVHGLTRENITAIAVLSSSSEDTLRDVLARHEHQLIADQVSFADAMGRVRAWLETWLGSDAPLEVCSCGQDEAAQDSMTAARRWPTAAEVDAQRNRWWWVDGEPSRLHVDRMEHPHRVMWHARYVEDLPAGMFGGLVPLPDAGHEHRAEGAWVWVRTDGEVAAIGCTYMEALQRATLATLARWESDPDPAAAQLDERLRDVVDGAGLRLDGAGLRLPILAAFLERVAPVGEREHIDAVCAAAWQSA